MMRGLLASIAATLVGAGLAVSAPAAPDTFDPPLSSASDTSATPETPDTVDVPVTGSQLAYDVTSIEARAGTRLVIRLVNDGSMPHNLVLVRSEGSINPVGMGALEAADTEYIPESEMNRILGYTALASPEETVSFTITVPPPGEYPYICTFPGHFRSMQGVLTSVE